MLINKTKNRRFNKNTGEKRKVFLNPITVVLVGSHYSGKTTLTRLFNKKLNFVPIEECWIKNPFIHNQKDNMLKNQIWYLSQAAQGIRKAEELNKRGKNVVLDTFAYSTLIFSKITLSEKDFNIFHRLFNSLVPNLPLPDLLIYLRAGTDYLYNKRRIMRIKSGCVPKTDLMVDYNWLDKSAHLHDIYFNKWRLCLAIVVDIENKDFINCKVDFESLIASMKKKCIQVSSKTNPNM